MDASSAGRSRRVAFLLAQVGALASTGFAKRSRELGLTPADAGVLRLVGQMPGLSQRVLADRLGAVPSRVVPLIDSLEQRSLVARQRSTSDRRNYELRLTDEGQTLLAALRTAAEQHERTLLSGLSADDAQQLEALLARIATEHGLDADLHSHTVTTTP
jgi:DNA-binding MarR family transcriptional regulator